MRPGTQRLHVPNNWPRPEQSRNGCRPTRAAVLHEPSICTKLDLTFSCARSRLSRSSCRSPTGVYTDICPVFCQTDLVPLSVVKEIVDGNDRPAPGSRGQSPFSPDGGGV